MADPKEPLILQHTPAEGMPDEDPNLVKNPVHAEAMAHTEDRWREEGKIDQGVKQAEAIQKQIELRELYDKANLNYDEESKIISGSIDGHTFEVGKDGFGKIDGMNISSTDGKEIYAKYMAIISELRMDKVSQNYISYTSAEKYVDHVIDVNVTRKADNLKKQQVEKAYKSAVEKILGAG